MSIFDFEYEDDWKHLFIVGGFCLLAVMFFSCNAPAQKPDPKPGSYDIVTDTEICSYVDGYKVYSVVDVRELKGRYSKSVSIVVEDENGTRYNQEYIWEWNSDFQETSYKNLSSLIVGDKVAIIQIDKEWDINNLRRVRVSEQGVIESEGVDTEIIDTEVIEITEVDTEFVDTEVIETEILEEVE